MVRVNSIAIRQRCSTASIAARVRLFGIATCAVFGVFYLVVHLTPLSQDPSSLHTDWKTPNRHYPFSQKPKDVVLAAVDLPISAQRNATGFLRFVPTLGGLATGLSAYNQRAQHKWIGWAGIVADNLTEPDKRDMDEFSHGFCSSILWPVFTDGEVTGNASFNYSADWRAYQTVNTMFLDKILNVTDAESSVWIHDFQLMLLPAMLRQRRPRSRIGFFFHIPFPAPKRFVTLSWGKEIMEGLLGADLLGFQIVDFAKNFLETVAFYGLGRVNNVTISILNHDRRVRVGHFPIGIDYEKFSTAQEKVGVVRMDDVERLKKMNLGRKIILTVDRLDPAKALLERVDAFQSLLKQHSRFRGKVSLFMVVVPHRLEVKRFRNLGITLQKQIDSVNRDFGDPQWQPITLLYQFVPFDKLVTLYQLADVAFIAPWRDGMNLVAKEYLASNERGVLVLSRSAGAARDLTEAVLVDVRQPASMVNGLLQALTMPAEEARRRAGQMRKYLQRTDVHAWGDGFVRTLMERGL
ncbi:uncharacterized protein LOC129600998 [Paramacrobiotus metropolitanus]|uniref:Bifunctional trehalose-6-phosphate synthase/trehalose phosphatase n=1 Tax=Paramacrobiotus metropolitanus TaxID=2943436 RepID=A0A8E4DJK6_9BILA|nr:uncharacterized protein LOC129600998 [Paramacrobiotus metropolitanus]BCY04413.1 bifunctional trehalose-6-phosphate synthase/trehalose phosphatase [Paramacrobiotus metropolitanus]